MKVTAESIELDCTHSDSDIGTVCFHCMKKGFATARREAAEEMREKESASWTREKPTEPGEIRIAWKDGMNEAVLIEIVPDTHGDMLWSVINKRSWGYAENIPFTHFRRIDMSPPERGDG